MLMVQADDLLGLTRRIYELAGAPPDIAQHVAGSLVKTNLLGHDSHGVLRIARYVEKIRKRTLFPAAQPRISRQRISSQQNTGTLVFRMSSRPKRESRL